MTPRIRLDKRKISPLSRCREAEESRCWKERVSRNGDNDTMDHGEARFRLHCERRWKQFCRIWVPLPFPIRDAFPKTRSLEVGETRVRSRSFAKRKAINPNNFLPSPQLFFSHTVKLSKQILNACIPNLCNNYRNIIVITVIIIIILIYIELLFITFIYMTMKSLVKRFSTYIIADHVSSE